MNLHVIIGFSKRFFSCVLFKKKIIIFSQFIMHLKPHICIICAFLCIAIHSYRPKNANMEKTFGMAYFLKELQCSSDVNDMGAACETYVVSQKMQ